MRGAIRVLLRRVNRPCDDKLLRQAASAPCRGPLAHASSYQKAMTLIAPLEQNVQLSLIHAAKSSKQREEFDPAHYTELAEAADDSTIDRRRQR